MMEMTGHVLSTEGVHDLSPEALDSNGQVKVLPAAFYESTSPIERSVFAVRNGLYCLPTVELVELLRQQIGERSAIEIGAGNGVLAKALGIPATDNMMQADPTIQALYASMRQPAVRYGDNVELLAARDAVRKYKPEVVVAAWVTHKYEEKNHKAGGNMFGVDEFDVLAHCEQYIFIGNTAVHAKKPLWRRAPIVRLEAPWLYSRAFNGTPNFIAVWQGSS